MIVIVGTIAAICVQTPLPVMKRCAADSAVGVSSAGDRARRADQEDGRVEQHRAQAGPARARAHHREGAGRFRAQGPAARRRRQRTRSHPQHSRSRPARARAGRHARGESVRRHGHLRADARHHRRGARPHGRDAEPRRPKQARSWHRRRVHRDDLRHRPREPVLPARGEQAQGRHPAADRSARDGHRRNDLDRARRESAQRSSRSCRGICIERATGDG